MKKSIIFFSRFKNKGGAAIATERLINVFNKNNNNVEYIFFQPKNYFLKLWGKIIFFLDSGILKLINKDQIRSLNFFRIFPFKNFSKYKNVIINLHWFHGGLISINQINQFNAPVVLTLHDSWIVNATSHHSDFNSKKTWILELLDKWTINRLRKINNISLLITPSNWLKQEIINGKIFDQEKIIVIPNPLNVEKFKPLLNEKKLSDKIRILVYFSGAKDPYKGGDLFLDFLELCSSDLFFLENIEFVIVGSNDILAFDKLNISSHGFISSESELISVYQSCEICISFSKRENLPQFMTQAASCGLVLFGFEIGGMDEIIFDNKNGYIIKPFDLLEMISKIKILIKSKDTLKVFSKYSREIALNLWDENIIYDIYKKTFDKLK